MNGIEKWAKKCLQWNNGCVTITRLAKARLTEKITRRCGKCPENVKYAAKVRHQETLFLTPTSIQRENGMLISRP